MSKDLSLTWCAISHQGLVRKNNQDAWGKFPRDIVALSYPPGQLFVVADGLGGHNAGQVASKLAVRSIGQAFRLAHKKKQPMDLRAAIKKANKAIFLAASSDAELTGMGTTLSALLIQEETATIGHVGDSRIFRVTRKGIDQLTEDHSQVAELERQGILTSAEAREHPERNILTRALGTMADVLVDLMEEIPVASGVHFLLCSDGLAKVTPEELYESVLKHDPKDACEELVQLANDRGGEDNVTVQIVRLAAVRQSLAQRISNFFR